MARSIWTGVISFGLVSVPVRLYSATQDHDVSFHQFEAGTADRIRYQRVNERTGKEVAYEKIVRGADVGDGRHVLIDSAELDSVAPGRSRSLDIHAFVELAEIDPIYYQRTYYLGPGSEETVKTYALLRDAMADAHRAAVATLVMRGKEYLAVIRPDGDLLVLETMYFADEIRDPKEQVERVPSRAKARPQETKMARQLIDSMTESWHPEQYRDTYTDRVNELIEAKRDGSEVTVAEQAPRATDVGDLMKVLQDSVAAAKKSTPKRSTPRKSTPEKVASKSTATAAAKKAAPKKSTSARKAATGRTAAGRGPRSRAS